MVCKLVLAACWRASTPLPTGFYTRVTSSHCSQLSPEQLIQGIKEEASVLCTTRSHKSHTVTSTLLYWSHRPALIHCGRRLHREINARRQGLWGPFWRLTTTVSMNLIRAVPLVTLPTNSPCRRHSKIECHSVWKASTCSVLKNIFKPCNMPFYLQDSVNIYSKIFRINALWKHH